MTEEEITIRIEEIDREAKQIGLEMKRVKSILRPMEFRFGELMQEKYELEKKITTIKTKDKAPSIRMRKVGEREVAPVTDKDIQNFFRQFSTGEANGN